MYTRHEIYWILQECKTWSDLVFTCRWLELLIKTGLQSKTDELRTIADRRFREMEGLV